MIVAHVYTTDFCRHPRQELHQRTDAIGRPVYLHQCLDLRRRRYLRDSRQRRLGYG